MNDKLEAALLRLRDADQDERRGVFDDIRTTCKAQISESWSKVRAISPTTGWEMDGLQSVEVKPPTKPIRVPQAVVVVVEPGAEQMCEWLIQTIRRFGDSPNVHIVVFCLDSAYTTLEYLDTCVPNLTRIQCRSVGRINAAVKDVLYSLARWVQADAIITFECDMLLTGSLLPLWSVIEQTSTSVLFGCPPIGNPSHQSFSEELALYQLPASDLAWITGLPDHDDTVRFNGGLLAGKREAWQKLDEQIRAWMPYAALWIEGFPGNFGDELVLDMAIGQVGHADLSARWNVQSFDTNRIPGFQTEDIDQWTMSVREHFPRYWFRTEYSGQGVRYSNSRGEAACVLHFAGGSRPLMREIFYELLVKGLCPEDPSLSPYFETLRKLPLELLSDLNYLETALLPLMGTYDPLGQFGPRQEGHGLRIWQFAPQFAPYLHDLSAENIHSYLEIGLQWGGCFAFTVEYLSRFSHLERAWDVDIVPCPLARNYDRPGVEFLMMHSQSMAFHDTIAGQHFDLVLIDGDHNYRAVKADYELIVRECSPGFIVFHDIANAVCPGVGQFWNELKAEHEQTCSVDEASLQDIEFREYTLQPRNRPSTLGIGVMIRRSTAPFPLSSNR